MKVGGILPLQKLVRFKLELAEAVKTEKYERAARLRDRIKELEQQLTRPPKRLKRVSDVA
jgi:protein-arginine kinase activator protein McsA